jgi:hypothetical protein
MADTSDDQPITALGEDSEGFAAFDKTLGVFKGGVFRGKDARKSAGSSRQFKAAKDAGHDVEVRKV